MLDTPHSKKFSSRCTKRNVRTRKVMNGCFGEHCVVLDFRLPEWWAIASDKDQLSYVTV